MGKIEYIDIKTTLDLELAVNSEAFNRYVGKTGPRALTMSLDKHDLTRMLAVTDSFEYGQHVHELVWITLADGRRHQALCSLAYRSMMDFTKGLITIRITDVASIIDMSDDTAGSLANMDPCFDLYNMKTITEIAKNRINEGTSTFIIIINIDNFRVINENKGPLYGDEVIAAIVKIIKNDIADLGELGRIDGDEFMVVLDRAKDYSELRNTLRKIRSNIADNFADSEGKPTVTVSIGAANFPSDARNYDDTFRLADAMMKMSKEKGKNRYIFYEAEIHGDVLGGEAPKNQSEQVVIKDKEDCMLRLQEQFLKKQKYSYYKAFFDVSETFGLDEIIFIKENLDVRGHWSRDDVSKHTVVNFKQDPDFMKLFDERGIARIDSVQSLGAGCAITKGYMEMRGIKSMIVSKFDENGVTYFVVFSRIFNQPVRWQDDEIRYLTLIGNMIRLENEYR